MTTADDSKLMTRYAIRDELTPLLITTCNMKSRTCRGGSKDLYKLLIKSKSMGQYMTLDKDHLQIVSGLGHTFIRYKDDTYNRYLYIDPTIAQFDPTFEGIFIGDEQDLRDIAARQIDMKGYKLDLTDYLGYDIGRGPPLQVEKRIMNEAAMSGGRRRTKRTRKGLKKKTTYRLRPVL